jgi:hypothetical protein
MCGVFPGRRRTLTGMALAALLSLMMLPIYIVWIDPLLLPAIKTTGDANMLAMRYPTTVSAQLALFMWSASFEVMLFQGGVMSVVSRITGRQWIAVLAAVGVRTFVTSEQLSPLHLVHASTFLLSSSALITTVSCMLFARFGLPASMTFSSGICLHILFQ